MTAPIPPTGEPHERRKFQLTNLDGNNNKYYLVETWELPNQQVFFRATYGRVGSSAQIDEKVTTEHWVARKIREKQAKGYQEIALHRPGAPTNAAASGPPIDPRVQRVVEQIFTAARDRIASYLAVEVDALSELQLQQGRALLQTAQQQYALWQRSASQQDFAALAASVQQFYNAIPTQLPSRIDREKVVQQFVAQFDEQEDRLNQLAAALASYATQQSNPQLSLYDLLGAELSPVAQNDTRYGEIVDYVARTSVHGYTLRVQDIFSVCVPDERRAFERNTRGKQHTQLLFHGTPSQNMRHILKSGLICPTTPSHGRMFGHGIYFANKATKSANYCSAHRRGGPQFLMLAEVALGRQYVARTALPNRHKAPWLHDSVWGKAGVTGSYGAALHFDEFIVYSAQQQTIRYLVTFDR